MGSVSRSTRVSGVRIFESGQDALGQVNCAERVDQRSLVHDVRSLVQGATFIGEDGVDPSPIVAAALSSHELRVFEACDEAGYRTAVEAEVVSQIEQTNLVVLRRSQEAECTELGLPQTVSAQRLAQARLDGRNRRYQHVPRFDWGHGCHGLDHAPTITALTHSVCACNYLPMSTRMATAARFVGQAAVWGTSFLLIKVALEEFSPYQLVTGRVVVAALVLFAVARWRGVRLAAGLRTWVTVTISALLALVFPYWLLSVGETSVSASTAGTLIGATPLLTLTLGAILHRQRPGLRRVAGFLFGFVGLVVILQPWHAAAGSGWGLLACLAAAASYAAGYVYADHITASRAAGTAGALTPLGLAASQLVAASAVLLVVFPIAGMTPVSLAPAAIVSTVALGIGASGVASLWYFQLVAAIGPANASAVDYLVPVFAVLAGALALGEHIPAALVIGGIIMLGGLAIAEGRLRTPSWARNTEPFVPAPSRADQRCS